MFTNFHISVPSHGVPMTISEIISAGVEMDGKSVRIVGRVDQYDASKSVAVLSEPNKSALLTDCKKLMVDTRLSDSSDYILGSQLMLIGELESCGKPGNESTGHILLKARVTKCVDRLDYALYCKALDVWRKYDATNT